MDDSTKGGYRMILGTDLLNALGLDIKFSEHVIIGSTVPYEGCPAPIVEINKY